ncbi:DNA-directed RNA polymerase subunit beta [Cohnella hongkongensis]|uniref:DNA-directed RNA polymerase subunit beta n=1 Tax=Cohnella hongkongensis TaxID=178337 RepID=A0ABV9FG35_9BACL
MKAPSRSNGKSKPSAGRIVAQVVWMSFKLLIIPVLCIAALIVGLAIGFSVLGDRPVSEVFDIKTWKHMYDLVFADGA